eukprot:g63136.t1
MTSSARGRGATLGYDIWIPLPQSTLLLRFVQVAHKMIQLRNSIFSFKMFEIPQCWAMSTQSPWSEAFQRWLEHCNNTTMGEENHEKSKVGDDFGSGSSRSSLRCADLSISFNDTGTGPGRSNIPGHWWLCRTERSVLDVQGKISDTVLKKTSGSYPTIQSLGLSIFFLMCTQTRPRTNSSGER